MWAVSPDLRRSTRAVSIIESRSSSMSIKPGRYKDEWLNEFDVCWRNYALADDNTLTPMALRLKRQLLDKVVSSLPDDVLKKEWARRNGLRGGRPIKNDPKTEVVRVAQREYRRRRRAEGKDK